MANIIETNSLNKSFHDPVEFQALRNVNMAIKQGEFASIVGSSGSGKSTLLYVLSTLDTDYTGHIFFDGDDLIFSIVPNPSFKVPIKLFAFISATPSFSP